MAFFSVSPELPLKILVDRISTELNKYILILNWIYGPRAVIVIGSYNDMDD